MPKKTIVYLSKITYPSKKAHAIQITRTVTALAAEAPVLFVVNTLTCPRDKVQQTILADFGCTCPDTLKIVQINSLFLNKACFFPILLALLKKHLHGRDFTFYTRSYSLVLNLIARQAFHKKKIFFESHKKDAIYKDDQVENTKYHKVRSIINARNTDIATIKKVYEAVDTVFFLHRHSEVRAKEMFNLKDSDFLWYGAKRHDTPPFQERKRDFCYCGGIGENKIFDLLLDVAQLLGPSFQVDVFGGTPEQIKSRKEQAERLGLSANFSFLGYVNNNDLAGRLQQYRFGFAFLEGIKVVDYIENGVFPIIPAIPSLLDIFDDQTALVFQPDTASDLVRVIQSIPNRNFDNAVLPEIVEKYSMRNRALTITAHL